MKKAFKYILVSINSFLINNLLNYIFKELLELKPFLSISSSFAIVLTINFILTKFLVFEKSSIDARKLFVYYIILVISFRIIEYLLFLFLYYSQLFDYFILLNTILISSAIIKYVIVKRLFEKEHKKVAVK